MNTNGFKKIDQGKYVKAEKKFKNVLSKHPDNADAYYGLGVAYRKLEHIEKSLIFLSGAIELGNQKAIRERGEVYYTLSHRHKGPSEKLKFMLLAMEDVADIDKSLQKYPEIVLKNAQHQIKKNDPQLALEQVDHLMQYVRINTNVDLKKAQLTKYQLLLDVSRYHFKNKNFKKAHTYVDVVLNSNISAIGKFQKNAQQLKSSIFKTQSNIAYRNDNFPLAIQFIDKAIKYTPNQKKLYDDKTIIYFEFSKKLYRDGALETALENVNSVVNYGNKTMATKGVRLRAQIYFAMSKKESTVDDQIIFAVLAYADDLNNAEITNYLTDLYLTKAVQSLQNTATYDDAYAAVKKASEINSSYRNILYLLENASNTTRFSSVNVEMAKAELHASLLRYTKAIQILENISTTNWNTIAKIKYALARYHTVTGDYQKALGLLQEFYYSNNLRSYYKTYRRLAASEIDFLPLQENRTFYRWFNGINRVRFELNKVSNIPKGDPGVFRKSDPIVQIFHKDTRLLTTLKQEDVVELNFPSNYYYAVFDYDFDESLIFKVIDMDLDDDDLVAYGAYSELYPSALQRWELKIMDMTSERRDNSVRVNFSLTDASHLDYTVSSWNGMPQTPWLLSIFKSNTNDDQYSKMAVDYYSLASMSARELQNKLTLKGFAFRLVPCSIMLGVSLNVRGFLLRQVAYLVFSGFKDNTFSSEYFVRDGFIEYMADKLENGLIINLNNVRTFCECVSGKVIEEWKFKT